MAFVLPVTWNSYVIRDPSGAVRRRGTQGSPVDVAALTSGRYQIGSATNASLRAELIVAPQLPGGFFLAEDRGNGQLAISFDAAAYTGPFRVTITSDKGTSGSYYVYDASNVLSLGLGNWTVTMARPGEAGVTSQFGFDGVGSLTSVNTVSVIAPVMLDYGSEWSVISLVDSDGRAVRSEAATGSLDVTGLPAGQYSVTGTLNGRVRREVLIISDAIAGGAVSFEQPAPGSPIAVTIANFVPGTAYRLLTYSASADQSQNFYVYRNQAEFSLPVSGDWTFSLAQPGQAGLTIGMKIAPDGLLATVDGLDVPVQRLLDLPAGQSGYHILDPAGNVVRSGQQVAKADFSGLKDGRYAIKFGLSDATQFDVVVSKHLPGGVMSFEQVAPGGRMQLTLSGVTATSPVRLALYSPGTGVIEQFYAYDNNVSVNVPDGNWFLQVARPSQSGYDIAISVAADGELVSLENEAISTDRKLSLPSGWPGFVLTDPSGKVVRESSNASQLDFTGLAEGRYSLVRSATSDDRRHIIISNEIPGEIAFLRQAPGQPAVLFFVDPMHAPYHLTHIYDAQDKLVSSFYIYGDELSLDLPSGDYRIAVATVGAATFEVRLSIKPDGAVLSLDNVDLLNKPDWFARIVNPASALSPITFNSGLAHLNVLGNPGARYLIEIRSDSTGAISKYVTSSTDFSLPLINGSYSWRAFVLPQQEISTTALESFLTAQVGGWSRFDQVSEAPHTDYVFGLEPDRIQFPMQLRLNYPTDSIVLSDGCILVSNTLSSNIYRFMPDGSLRRAAGGYSAGYTAAGDGPSVLLNSPAQMQLMANGMVWIVDYENHVIREYNPATGHTRTIFGSPSGLDVVIDANGNLVSVGDVFAIGVDDDGRAFISAARAGELSGSHETKVIRQDENGKWQEWIPETKTLGLDYRFTDLLFEDDRVWAIVQTKDGARTLLRFSALGTLTGSVLLPSQFGGGLLKDPQTGHILVADHGDIISLDPTTLTKMSYDVPLDLNNVASIEINGNILTVTDSDAGQIYRFDTISRKVIASYGASSAVSNVYVDLDESNGRLYALDNQTPRLVELHNGAINVIAGNGKQQQANFGVSAIGSSLRYPGAFTIGPDGTAYVVESNHRILAIGPDSIIRPFAGSLNGGYSGNGGKAVNANFQSIYGLEYDLAGNMLVADSFNHAIRSIDRNGIVQTIAGSGRVGISSNAFDPNGALNTPLRTLATEDGRLFISDSWNNRVVELINGNRLVNVAGVDSPGNYQGGGSFGGDGGLAVNARLNTPVGLAYYAADQTLFIVDSFNDRVRYVDSAGNIHTLIGGDRGYAFGALLNLPSDVALIGDDLYVADTGNALVLKIVGVDRTGNDFANALDVGQALTRVRFDTRSEYVAADDVDVYNLAGFANGVIAITAAGSGLTLDFSNGSNPSHGKIVLNLGQSVEIDADSHKFLIVSANTKQKYTMAFAQSSMSSAVQKVANTHHATNVDRRSYDRRIPLMVQAMNSFIGGHGQSFAKYNEPAPTFDFFA